MQTNESQGSMMGISMWDPCCIFIAKSLLYPSCTVASLALTLAIRRHPFDNKYFLVAVLIFLAAADFLGHPDTEISTPFAFKRLYRLTFKWLGLVAFFWALLDLSGFAIYFSPAVFLVWALITPPVFALANMSAKELLRALGRNRRRIRNAIVIGVTPPGLKLEHQLRQDTLLGIRCVGFFEDRSPSRLPDQPNAPLLGTLQEVPGYLAEHVVHDVYITLPISRQPRIVQLLAALEDSTASVHFVPDVSLMRFFHGRLDVLHGIPLLSVCQSPFYGLRSLAKRCCDVALASLAVICAAPLLIGVAIGVRLSSPGPIIFKQRRYGLDGQEIVVYKFRSMTVTEDGSRHYTQVTRNDARVTTFGAFIRRTSLDELPQLFNVLEGSMSLVGPRPHAIAVNEQYRRLIPGYMVRHKVLPGITGWAQVNGCRGGDDLASMQARIAFDIEYLRRWSLLLDIAILCKTATLVFNDRRAY
jgi:putative colanic acid biosynthesis UDP-glucose lipid carrier transferase